MEPVAAHTSDTDPAEVAEKHAGDRRRRKFQYASLAMKSDRRPNHTFLQESPYLGWLTNSSVWWRHPICRIAVTWIILLQDFFIYGEDPVNDSHVGANYIGMGNCLGLYAFWSAPNVGDALFKLILIAISLAGAVLIGRQFIVIKLLQERLQVSAFYGGEGCFCVVVLTFGCTSFAASYIYNIISADQIDGNSFEMFLILGAETKQYRHVGKCFQVLSAAIDFLTIVMITDAVLQDQVHHQFWAAGVKRWYNHSLGGYVRIVACWSLLFGGTISAAVLVFRSGDDGGVRWTDTNVGGTSELGRSFLASSIIFADILSVVQDWDFPMFRESLDVEVPMIAGTKLTELNCTCITSCVRRLPRPAARVLAWLPSADVFTMHITGKWLTYGPLLGVMGVDFMCARAQMLYEPLNYGQYANPADDRIWVIVDQLYLDLAYHRGFVVDSSMIRWEARRNLTTGAPLDASAATDVLLNSKYVNGPGTHYLAFIVCLGLLLGFCWLLWIADWQRAAEIERIERECVLTGIVRDPPSTPQPQSIGTALECNSEWQTLPSVPPVSVICQPPGAIFSDAQQDSSGMFNTVPAVCFDARYNTKISL